MGLRKTQDTPALDSLDAVPCADDTPLAEAICAAVDQFPPGFTRPNKVLAISSDGGENASDGECMGPPSLSGPPPPGFYESGSWQQKVYDKVQDEVVSLVRAWGLFGQSAGGGIDSETGLPLPLAVPDSTFFQDLAGSTGGNYAGVHDGDPSLPSFPFWFAAVPVGGWVVIGLGLGLAVIGAVRFPRLKR